MLKVVNLDTLHACIYIFSLSNNSCIFLRGTIVFVCGFVSLDSLEALCAVSLQFILIKYDIEL